MSDGMDCVCAAYSESECGCGADWTPQEVINLRQQLAHRESQIVMLRDALKEVQMVTESSIKTHGYDKQHVRNADVAKRALAVADDLDDYVLCNAEPVPYAAGRDEAGNLVYCMFLSGTLLYARRKV